MKEKFDLILFDLDGTLTDSSEGITKCVQYSLEKYGIIETDRKQLERFIGPPLIDSYMKYYGFTREQAIEARNVFNERYQPVGWKENVSYPGIETVLKTLKEQGKLLGIATSKPVNVAEKVLKLFGLWDYFSVFCAAPNNGIGGEKTGRILAALEEARNLGWEGKHPVMVGDTRFDVLDAHECGLPCVGVTWGFAVEGEFEACDTEYVVSSMEELLEVLQDP